MMPLIGSDLPLAMLIRLRWQQKSIAGHRCGL